MNCEFVNSELIKWDCDSAHEKMTEHSDSLNQIRRNIVSLQRVDALDALANGDITNSAILSDELVSQNTTYMNSIYVAYREYGLEGIAESYESILSIARQCPYQGGKPVYQARAFIELFNDTMDYQDDVNCLQDGIFRSGKEKISAIEQSISIKPNPANDKVEIALAQEEEGICTIRVNDLLGQSILHRSFNCEERKTTLDVSSLVCGIYVIEVRNTSGWHKTQKLIISR